MTDTQHTPGPWTWRLGYGGAAFSLTIEGVNDGHAQIAECDVENAHLIASAPELLEALENIKTELAALLDAPETNFNADDWPVQNIADGECLSAVFEIVQAAIAKAKGY